MVTIETEFIERLKAMKMFLAEKRLLTDLAAKTGVSRRTINDAFNVKSEKELRGKKLQVFLAAKRLREEIESSLNLSEEYNDEQNNI